MGADRYAGYEVDGRNVRNVVEAFRLFPDVGLKPFARRGIGKLDASGRITLDADGWYPLGPWLQAFDEITRVVGASKMFEIGRQVPKNSPFPDHIRDIGSALGSIDIAYHMNHRKHGKVMFDPATGTMLEGIGHYTFKQQPGARRAELVCENPYPCDLDRGLLVTLARRFEPAAQFDHADEVHCRKHGGARCTYAVSW